MQAAAYLKLAVAEVGIEESVGREAAQMRVHVGQLGQVIFKGKRGDHVAEGVGVHERGAFVRNVDGRHEHLLGAGPCFRDEREIADETHGAAKPRVADQLIHSGGAEGLHLGRQVVDRLDVQVGQALTQLAARGENTLADAAGVHLLDDQLVVHGGLRRCVDREVGSARVNDAVDRVDAHHAKRLPTSLLGIVGVGTDSGWVGVVLVERQRNGGGG